MHDSIYARLDCPFNDCKHKPSLMTPLPPNLGFQPTSLLGLKWSSNLTFTLQLSMSEGSQYYAYTLTIKARVPHFLYPSHHTYTYRLCMYILHICMYAMIWWMIIWWCLYPTPRCYKVIPGCYSCSWVPMGGRDNSANKSTFVQCKHQIDQVPLSYISAIGCGTSIVRCLALAWYP